MDHASLTMWCIVTSSTWSSAARRTRRPRMSGPRCRSKGARTSSAITRPSSASASARPSRSCSGEVESAASAGAIRCSGTPSVCANVVRRASWRATMPSSARTRAARSSAPRSRRRRGMWYVLPRSPSCSTNHSPCCANDSGSRSARDTGSIGASSDSARTRSRARAICRSFRRSARVSSITSDFIGCTSRSVGWIARAWTSPRPDTRPGERGRSRRGRMRGGAPRDGRTVIRRRIREAGPSAAPSPPGPPGRAGRPGSPARSPRARGG